MKVNHGRWTARFDSDVVLFRIGMRINRPWAVNRWVPVFTAMPRMLRELAGDEESGLLGYELQFGPRSATVVQFWRDFDALTRYAADPERTHRPAWLAYYRAGRRAAGAVGIWHETYLIRPGGHETLYVDMPAWGAGRVARLQPVGRETHRAVDRVSAGAGTP